MTVSFSRGAAAALAYFLASQAAWADLTAQQVWDEWRSYMVDVGYRVAGDESTSPGGLTVRDLVMSMDIPEEQSRIEIRLGSLGFAENGDGTVSVTLPDRFPIAFSGQPADGESFAADLIYSQTDAALVVSGDADEMIYEFAAAEAGLELGEVTVDGATLPAEAARGQIRFTDLESHSVMKPGDMREVAQTMSAASLSYDIAFADPHAAEKASFAGTLDGLEFEGAGRLPSGVDSGDIRDLLAAGAAFAGRFTYGSGEGRMTGSEDGSEFAFASRSQGGGLGFAMDAESLAYDVSGTGVDMNVQTSDLPFPLSMTMAEMAFKLEMPVARSEEEQPFSFLLKLADFAVPEELWGLVDPGRALPRDPATVLLDVSGRAKLSADLFDPMIAEGLAGDQPPGELHALTINELLVSAAGAKLSGLGEFTFDNTDLESFDGMPAPSGLARLQLVGANGLIDKLIGMGLMSEEDAMGARMMMGMLTVPGDAPDTLNSEITVTEEGHVLANGQRLK